MTDTDSTPPGRWTEAQHQLAQFEFEAGYELGYQAGRNDHIAEMAEWAERFCATAPGAEPTPIDRRYEQVIRGLTHRMATERTTG